jgi:hypothetical protein
MQQIHQAIGGRIAQRFAQLAWDGDYRHDLKPAYGAGQ